MANAGEVKVVFAADTAQYTAAVTKVRAQIGELQQASGTAAHASVRPWQAASAAIRVFEGNIANNVRAAERFIGTIKPLQGILVKAFPVVGAVALVGVFGEMASRVTKFIEDARKMPQAIADGFAEMNRSGQLAVDDLQKANDQLDNQIAKLQGKPQNNLALALDDARIAADKLAQSLAEDEKRVEALLKSNHIGLGAAVASQRDMTKESETEVNSINRRLSAAADAYSAALHKLSPEEQKTLMELGKNQTTPSGKLQLDLSKPTISPNVSAAITAHADLLQMRVNAEGIAQKEIDRYKGDFEEANRNIWQGLLTGLQQQGDLELGQVHNQQKTAQRDTLQHAKDLEEFQKKQLAAATKLSNELNAQRKQYDEMADAFSRTPGSASSFQLIPLLNAKGEPGKPVQGLPLLPEDLSKGDNRELQESSRTVLDFLKNLSEGPVIQKQNEDAMAAMSLQIEIASGRMSRFDAAAAMAALHTREFTDAMEALDAKQADLDAKYQAGKISRLDYVDASAKLKNQRAIDVGQYQLDHAQDEVAIRSATALGTFSDALAHTTQRLEDWSAKGAQLFDQTLGSVNDEIIHALTTRDHQKAFEFGNIGANLGRGIMGIGLEKMEGDVLKALGFGGGKPDGSASKPFHVVMGAVSAAGSAVSNDVGGLFGKILHVFHIPGFAEGGSIPSNMPAIVGERGPELFIPSTAGHIVPNHRLLGGGHTFNIPVDARGATDPAQVKAAARSAVREAIPAILQASLAASREERVRTPSMKR